MLLFRSVNFFSNVYFAKIHFFIKVISLCLILSTVFVIDYSLANGVITAKHFWFYITLAVMSITSLFGLKKRNLKINTVDILLLVFSCYALIVNVDTIYAENNTKWTLLLLIFILYFFFRNSLTDKRVMFYVVLFFLFTGLVEVIWGISQLYGSRISKYNLYGFTGSFHNSGIFGGYLSVIAPPSLFYILNDLKVFKQKFSIRFFPFYLRYIVSIVTFTGIISLLPATFSRAAWLSSIIGCIFVLIVHKLSNKKLNTYIALYWRKIIVIVIAILLFITIGLVGMFHLKKDSAIGHLLIWKISLQVITKHPMGVGMGHFPNAYGREQANYFLTSKNASETEKFVADCPNYAFNEYIQICIEYGVFASILLFMSFIILICIGFKQGEVSATSGFISLLIFASMSYPFNLLPFLVVLVFFMSVILSETTSTSFCNYTKKSISLNWRSCVLITSINVFVVFLLLKEQLPKIKAYKEWNYLKLLSSDILSASKVKDYENLYPYLYDQTDFLFEFAQVLSKNGEYEKSNGILKLATNISFDPMLYNIIGKNYQKMNKFDLAEQYFLTASGLVPNRIYPYFLLASLYYDYNEKEKFIVMANIVLKKKPKVQTAVIEEMRLKIKRMMCE